MARMVPAAIVVLVMASSVGGGRPGLCGNAQVTTPTACMDSLGSKKVQR
jgi:hypothetical protein